MAGEAMYIWVNRVDTVVLESGSPGRWVISVLPPTLAESVVVGVRSTSMLER